MLANYTKYQRSFTNLERLMKKVTMCKDEGLYKLAFKFYETNPGLVKVTDSQTLV